MRCERDDYISRSFYIERYASDHRVTYRDALDALDAQPMVEYVRPIGIISRIPQIGDAPIGSYDRRGGRPAPMSIPFCRGHGCFESLNLRACARCKMTQYCSRKCQKNHWKFHKQICKSPEMSVSSENNYDYDENEDEDDDGNGDWRAGNTLPSIDASNHRSASWSSPPRAAGSPSIGCYGCESTESLHSQRCPRCNVAHYCSRKCRREHSKAHAKTCGRSEAHPPAAGGSGGDERRNGGTRPIEKEAPSRGRDLVFLDGCDERYVGEPSITVLRPQTEEQRVKFDAYKAAVYKLADENSSTKR